MSELPTHFALSAALNSLTYTAAGFPGNGLWWQIQKMIIFLMKFTSGLVVLSWLLWWLAVQWVQAWASHHDQYYYQWQWWRWWLWKTLWEDVIINVIVISLWWKWRTNDVKVVAILTYLASLTTFLRSRSSSSELPWSASSGYLASILITTV